ncbi:YciC family protein [Moellerella wisconsensis]|uniref:YciC family protein n=1 Tax=Moellerella wisconsensis TaxID=158849 RepID=UPI0030767DB2
MSITANSLIRDSVNFFKNQLNGLLTISLLATVVSVVIYYLMIPNKEMIAVVFEAQNKLAESGNAGLQEWIKELSDQDKSSILRVSFGLILSITLGSLLLVSGTLSYILALSKGEEVSGLQALLQSSGKLVSMFVLLLVCSLLIQLGTAVMILPGVILAIGFSLAPSILMTEKVNPFSAMARSWKLAYANWRIILPMILIWMASQMLVGLLLGHIPLPDIIINGLSFFINNIIAAFVLIYFFRLYMLVQPPQAQ